MKKKLVFLIISFWFVGTAFSQSDSLNNLMNLFNNYQPATVYTEASFKTIRVVLGQSVETPAKGDLILDIQHHFGYEGAYQFFGLDQATMRLGFTYGITDWLAVGIGRSSYNKTYDANMKIKLLRQSTGKRNMPITLDYFGDVGLNSLKPQDLSIHYYFTNRLVFLNQILIARKFSPGITLQLKLNKSCVLAMMCNYIYIHIGLKLLSREE